MPNTTATTDPIVGDNPLVKTPFLRRFFAFDEFITARILKIVYILGSVLIVLYTLVQLATVLYIGFQSLTMKFHIEKFPGIIGGLLFYIIVGVFALLVLRLYCEFMMVIFKIYENLRTMRSGNVQV